MRYKVELTIFGVALLLFFGLVSWIGPILALFISLSIGLGSWAVHTKLTLLQVEASLTKPSTDISHLQLDSLLAQLTAAQAKIGIFYTHLDGGLVSANQIVRDWIQYEESEIPQLHMSDLFPAVPQNQWDQHAREVMGAGNKKIVGYFKRKNEELFPVEVHVNYVSFKEESFFLAFVHDLSDKQATEEALTESNERYSSVMAAMSEGVVLQKANGEITFANQAAETILGLDVDQMMGRTSLDERWRSVRQDGSPYPGEEHPAMLTLKTGQPIRAAVMGIHHPDGQLKWISINTHPLKVMAQSGPTAVVATFHDITEQKKAEQKLKESELLHRTLIDTLDIGLCRWLPDTSLTYTNKKYRELFGLQNKITGKKWIDFVPESNRAETLDFYQKLVHQPEVVSNEHLVTLFDGRNRHFRWIDTPILNPEGELLEFQSIGIDLTESKEQEALIEQSEKRYRNIFQSASISLWEEDYSDVKNAIDELMASGVEDVRQYLDEHPEWVKQTARLIKILDCNDAGVKMFEASSKEELLNSLDQIFTEESYAACKEEIIAIAEGESFLQTEARNRTLTGRDIDILMNIRFPKAGESFERIIVSIQDITELKQIQKVLVKTEERYRILFNLMDEGVAINRAIYNEEGEMVDYCVVDVNPAFERHSIYSKSQALGAMATDLYQMSSDFIRDWWYVHREKTETAHTEMFHEPSDRLFFIRTTPIKDHRFATIFIDISERKKAEGQLQKFATRFEVLHNIEQVVLASYSIPEMIGNLLQYIPKVLPYNRLVIASIDPLTKIKTYLVVDGAQKETAFRQGTQLPMDPSWFEKVEGKARVRIVENVGLLADPKPEESQLLELGIHSYISYPFIIQNQLIGLLSIGRESPGPFEKEEIEIGSEIANILALAIHQAELYKALSDSEKDLRELNVELEERVEERTMELNKRIVEVEQLNRQLETANKELEGFSYSVSHDLRAPLRHMNGFLGLLKKREKDQLDETSLRYLSISLESVSKMKQLIDDLLAFSKTNRTEMKEEEVDLGELISRVQTELQPDYHDRDIHWEVHPLPIVRADANLLKIVCTNLLSNAIKYTGTRDKANIEIGMKATESLVEEARSQENSPHSQEVMIFIKDNGVGFEEKYASKLFGVFQRLHRVEEFEGTGIGLATVRRIIHRHGGRVWATARLDQGATFYFTLPKSQSLKS
ncbi:MAG: PAS domain S-box protein [Bacteroidota bacterium]